MKDFVSIKHIAILMALLGLVVLSVIKMISSRYFISSDSELDSISHIVRHSDKILKKPRACFFSFKRGALKFEPQSIDSIKSENNFPELKLGAKVTLNYVLNKMTVQLLESDKNENLVMLKYNFYNKAKNKTRRYLKTFYVEKAGDSFKKCVQVNEVRL